MSPQSSPGLEVVFEELHVNSVTGTTSRWAYWEVDYSSTGLPAGSSAQGWTNLVSQQAPIADNTPPVIGGPVHSPSSPSPLDHALITFNVTDAGSGVKNATVYYTTDNWASTNRTVAASYNSTTHVAVATMPLFPSNTVVGYYILAWDNAGNVARNDNSGSYHSFSTGLLPFYVELWFYALIALAIASLLVLAVYMRSRKKPSHPVTS